MEKHPSPLRTSPVPLRLLRSVFVLAALAASFLLLPAGLAAQAEARFALVIGNSEYGDLGKLANPVNDAGDMAAALQRLGYQVELLKNADLAQMEEAAVRLSEQLGRSAQTTGIFYYAGHGVQAKDGNNYLIPARASISAETFLKTKALPAQSVLDLMQGAGNKLNLVFLDACRDNPFAWSRGGKRGLSVVGNQPPGSIVVYATSAGSTAGDGSGRNGVFTAELLKNLETPGLDLDGILNKTAQGVLKATRNQQNPAIYKQYFETAYLGASQAAATQASLAKTAPTEAPDWGTISVEPGNVVLSFASAGSLSFKGKTLSVPAGGSLPVNKLSPGDYSATVTYPDGQTENLTVTVEPGKTANVAFVYKPAPKPTQAPAHTSPGQGFTNSVGMDFVPVAGGSFMMGSPTNEAGREPWDKGSEKQHNVKVEGFQLSKTTVTQAQWQQVMGGNPSYFKSGCDAPQRPVEQVSWYDALVFCNRLSLLEGRKPVYAINGSTKPDTWGSVPTNADKVWDSVVWDKAANGYRLPTETEWEYAARGGAQGTNRTVAWSGGSTVDEVAWYSGNSRDTTHPVAQKKPNDLGLYDMSGNVWQWCQDWYQTDISQLSDKPVSPGSGVCRVLRGGSWVNDAIYVRTAVRTYGYPYIRNYDGGDSGFRVLVSSGTGQ